MMFLALAACEANPIVDDKDPGDTGDSTVEDIDDTHDTAADTGHDDTGDDTGDEPDEMLTWNVTGSFDGSAFSLVHLQFPETDDGDMTMGAVWIEGGAAETISIPAEEPPDDYFQVAGGGLSLGAIVGGLHEDDGDVRWELNESWVAASTQWVIYFDGAVPPELLAMGIVSGWNALEFVGENFTLGDSTAMPLPVALKETLVIGGTYDHTINHEHRVVALPATAFGGLPVSSVLDDVGLEADGTWSVTLDGEPPADHFADIDGNGEQEAVELPVAYADNDGSLAYSGGDRIVSAACIGDVPIGGWWLDPPTNILTLVSVQMQGLTLGWIPVLIGGDGVVSEDDALTAVLSTDCGLDE